jgi:8-oxo-dGTP pyrophosphatase MutT (NUDIX family)
MSSAAKNFPKTRLTSAGIGARWSVSGALQVSRLVKLRECEQVAAVCYRLRERSIEFLLVQTRGSRRWTFPKGGAEPGLTHAQAAAIEAFEEAGVHGRIENSSFVRYLCSKQAAQSSSKRSDSKRSGSKRSGSKWLGKRSTDVAVSAHLCEVLRLSKPKEPNRNRTWFSVEKTKFQLRKGREEEDGDTFARVVDRAAARIQTLHREDNLSSEKQGNGALHRGSVQSNKDSNDPLRRVHQEAGWLPN